MREATGLDSKAAALRRAFDQSFAAPPPQASQEVEDLLRIRVAGDPYAIRLRDVAGIVARRKVVAVPSGTLDLLGLAGIRGGIVPVFGLVSILGYGLGYGLGHGQVADAPAWMILCGSEEPIALAFPEFEGYGRFPKSSLHLDDNFRPARQYVKEVARMDAEVRAVISIPLVVATIRTRTSHTRLAKEN